MSPELSALSTPRTGPNGPVGPSEREDDPEVGRWPVHVGHFDSAVGHSEGAHRDPGGAGPTLGSEATGAFVASLRAQGLSIRAISERTGLPRSTVADHVARAREAAPVRIVGRDGRRYLAVRDPRLGEPTPPMPGGDDSQDVSRPADPSHELRRLLLLGSLRQARDLLPDVLPLAEHDRLRIALDLAAITRIAGVRDGDVARARGARKRASRDDWS